VLLTARHSGWRACTGAAGDAAPGAPQAKQLTQDEYAMNHPSGRIGKRLMLRVTDVMLTGGAVPCVPPQARSAVCRPPRAAARVSAPVGRPCGFPASGTGTAGSAPQGQAGGRHPQIYHSHLLLSRPQLRQGELTEAAMPVLQIGMPVVGRGVQTPAAAACCPPPSCGAPDTARRRAQATVMEVLSELTAKGVGCVLVVSGGGALLGTFTDGDLRRALQGRGAQARARGACLSARTPPQSAVLLKGVERGCPCR
jgi:hypothetical protein